MIFATVGTQLPFPRLMQAMSDLAPRLGEPILAQTGRCDQNWPGLQHQPSFTPQEYKSHFQEARVVVAHAGIGSILSAKRWNKPLIIMPRRYHLREHRNDHQLATARQVANVQGVYLAWEAEDLEGLLMRTDLVPADDGQSEGTQRLIQFIRAQL